jgi:hypothetical protein
VPLSLPRPQVLTACQEAAALKRNGGWGGESTVKVHEMTRNGKQRPPRPQIEIQTANASPEEAAAIAAALERFLVETAPAPQAAQPASRWQQTALREGVGGRPDSPDRWGLGSR